MQVLITFSEIAARHGGAVVCGASVGLVGILVSLEIALRLRTLFRVDRLSSEEFRAIVQEGLLRAGYFVWGDKVGGGGPPIRLVTLMRKVDLGPHALGIALQQGPSFIVTNRRMTVRARRLARSAGTQVIDRLSLARLVEGLRPPPIVYQLEFGASEERLAA